MNKIFQIFGSADSQDIDVAVFVEEIPNIKASSLLCASFREDLSELLRTDKEVNTNIAVLKDGQLIDVYKGTTDELNNALLATYALHEQIHPCQIMYKLDRDVTLKMLRCARKLLSYFSRTEHRIRIKEALRSDFKTKIEMLKTIEPDKYTDFGKKGSLIDFRKTAAFQLGQTLDLMKGKELYTKRGVAIAYPELENLLLRKEGANPKGLVQAWNDFVTASEAQLAKLGHLKEYRYGET